MSKSDPWKRTVIIGSVLGLINIVIHLAFYRNLEYHRDELLYFSLGMHPAFGYATVPPMIGWLAAAIQAVLGHSLFAVKIFPALLSGAFSFLCILITKEFGGRTYAQVLSGTVVLVMPFTLRSFSFFMPVAIDMTFWTLVLYFFTRFINTKKDKYLVIAMALSGAAMLNKYLVALLYLTLALSIVMTGNWGILRKRALYTGIGLGFLIFLPNMVWQLLSGLPVIRHMQELHDTQLVHVKYGEFLVDQLLSPLMGSLLMIPGLVFLLVKKQYRFLGITALLVILILMLLRGKSYYTLGVVPFLVSAGAAVMERGLKRKALQAAFLIFLVVASFPALSVGVPLFPEEGLLSYFKYQEDHFGITAGRRWEDGSIHSLPQNFADQLGWEEMAGLAAKAWAEIPDKDAAVIYCENYGEAGAISIIGKKYGLPEAISFNESFKYWVPRSFGREIKYLVYINWEMGDDVKGIFNNIRVIGSVSDPNAREYGTTVFLCSDPARSFNEFWKTVLARENIE